MLHDLSNMLDVPGMERAVRMVFTNGWQPGETREANCADVAEAIGLLGTGRWCYPPDESSDEAMDVHRDMLADALRTGTPAFLMVPETADMVHIQPL